MTMRLGTKSVLYGAHCVLFHWLFVAFGWWQLYGFRKVYIGDKQVEEFEWDKQQRRTPASFIVRDYARLWDPRLWMAFVIHDLGYWGKRDMDGETEGERHPEWACAKMNKWFGQPWGGFVLYHSRFYAKRDQAPVSPLCYADKLAIVYTPMWLYLPMVRATGEIKEYMKLAEVNNAGLGAGKYATMNISTEDEVKWYRGMQAYVRDWVATHKDGTHDTWTPESRTARDACGVWK